QLSLLDPSAADAVLLSAIEDPLEPRNFLLTSRDDYLSAQLERDPLLLAELLHGLLASPAVDGLERPGGIVDSRVEHAGVVSRLMLGHLGFLLQNQHAPLRELLAQAVGGGESHDPSAD